MRIPSVPINYINISICYELRNSNAALKYHPICSPCYRPCRLIEYLYNYLIINIIYPYSPLIDYISIML